jgi:hypothetical protein
LVGPVEVAAIVRDPDDDHVRACATTAINIQLPTAMPLSSSRAGIEPEMFPHTK